MSRTEKIEELQQEREQLKISTNLELERITKQLFKLHLKEFIEEHREMFEEHNEPIPSRIRLSYYSEYDDEGGTDPYVGDVYLYDEQGNLLDADLELLVNVSYKSTPVSSTLQEEIQTLLHDEFSVEDLENYIGEQLIIF